MSVKLQPTTWQCESSGVLSALGETKIALFPTFKGSPNLFVANKFALFPTFKGSPNL